MNHMRRLFPHDKEKTRRMDDSKKNPRKPRLERRNALKHFEYDASSSSSLSSEALITRSLDFSSRRSFRVEGFDGEFDRICQSLGLSVEDFAIPAAAWEARKTRSNSDILRRLNQLQEGENSEVVVRVFASAAEAVSHEASDLVDELGNRFGDIVKVSDVTELIQSEFAAINACSNIDSDEGIKGVRPPMLKPPPSMTVPIVDNGSSTWDLCRDFAPEADRDYSVAFRGEDSTSEEEEEEQKVVETVGKGDDARLSTSYSFTTSNDDDSSSSTTEPTSNSISPNVRFKHKITNWERGELLGRGSYGSVYEGISEDGFFFAVKEVSLLDQGSQGKKSVSQLEQEIALLSRFEHENIVQYLDTDKDESKLYIFLELVTKGSLQRLYQKYHLRDSQVSAYTRQILHGLKYLHDQNVIHRDIKCANILVDANGSVKLADFGLAKATKFNDIKSFQGTAFWMAPEVVNNKNQGYGLPADIWSLGCTVLEMLTRQLPYNLECYPALYKIGKGVPPDVPDTLSIDARSFILQCLKVDPKDRPTAAQLLDHPFVKRSLSVSSGSASPYLGKRL